MARGPNYRVPFRRRREGRTNYYLRRSLLASGKHRAIVRPSEKNITCQIADAHLRGDTIAAVAHSKELVKNFGWKYSTGNMPASYLVGYLLGKKALKAGITEAIADIGLRIRIHRTYAALKGIVDAGLDVPHSEEIFPAEDRLVGKHIEEYAKQLKDEQGAGGDEQEVNTQFARYEKDKADATKISSMVAEIKKKIDKQYA